MKLKGKVALITGAGLGMGRATALLFSQEGAEVIINDLNKDDLETTLDMLEGNNNSSYIGDISESDIVKDMFKEIETKYHKIDIVVNNAGIGRFSGDGENGEIQEMEDVGWKGVMGVNLDGTFFVSREAVRLMLKKETKGSLINISSTSAFSGEGPLHYCTSKGALLSFTRALAVDLGSKGIRVNAICPGPTATRMLEGIPDEWVESMVSAIPLGRVGQPEEVAKTSLFLASEDSSFFTGQTLAANGGSFMI
ncbi:MAG: SDR family oxidoreductase [Pseudomonadota bacterium]|nr:SDR family oxidoreductase [Pseudomonadota bacterium]|tara:strand:- start:2738 stop:3493 length:756 start_codon:yes stop_codon:yes gene_type:complete